MLDLAFLNEILHRARHVFDWHIRVNAMLIEEIDDIDLEPFERGFGDLLDVLRAAIEAARSVGINLEPEFGRYRHLPANGLESFTNEFFVDEWAVNFGGIEEGYTAVDGGADER